MACSGSVIGHYNVSYALFVTLLGYQNRITIHPSNTSTKTWFFEKEKKLIS